MPIVHVPQRKSLDSWVRLQRFFGFEGRAEGLRYSARFDVVELSPGDESAAIEREPGARDDESRPA